MVSGLIALVFWVLISGTIPAVVKLALYQIPPFTISFFRFFIASLILVPFYMKQKDIKMQAKGIWKMLVVGSLGTGFNAGIYAYGLQFTSTIVAQLLYALTPLLIGILGFLFFKTKVTKQQIIGAFIGFVGVIFLFQQAFAQQNILTLGTPLGNGIVFIAVLFWSFYTLFTKELSKHHSSITTTFMSFLGGTVVLGFVVPVELIFRRVPVSEITLSTGFDILFLGIFGSALVYFLYQYGIKKTSAFTASLGFYLAPLTVAFSSTIILHEIVTPSMIVGAFLILFGVFYATVFPYIKKGYKSVLQ
ncbi:MAG: DMT family transporter [Candidatus Levybacteria bacterium]|nr:DMT family transporter [Candidatus Levybacteria bacterium]